ncbi:hypothetical protein KIH07_16895 [Hydrogenophaga taeniospiralis]|uniref:Cro/CI family transcriptional regulator n=1 Tax=Hydrogenophaga taeniospiralis TaxID=65656 RepID=UPI001CF9DC81|nr:Cro/CI family transcriptional regulator [Hydrogenophaga taeniospiralis]MCB4365423.1 hypothetical protein [Hydrogenophaga taeniospiralis]
MKKSQAIELLGGTVPKAAEALRVTYQAVDKWPDDLPLRISDRVLGAYTRLHGAVPVAKDPDAPQPAEQAANAATPQEQPATTEAAGQGA